MKIAIIIEGGLVRQVLAEAPADVITLDLDTEGAFSSDLTRVPVPDELGKWSMQDAYVNQFPVGVQPDYLRALERELSTPADPLLVAAEEVVEEFRELVANDQPIDSGMAIEAIQRLVRAGK